MATSPFFIVLRQSRRSTDKEVINLIITPLISHCNDFLLVINSAMIVQICCGQEYGRGAAPLRPTTKTQPQTLWSYVMYCPLTLPRSPVGSGGKENDARSLQGKGWEK